MTPINPETLLVAKLQAQQWNVVIAGLGELPHKISAPVEKLLLDQLQAPLQEPPPEANGIDKHPPVQFQDYDPVPRPPPSS